MITKFPELIGIYDLSGSDVEVMIEDDIRSLNCKISDEDIDAVIDAVKEDSIKLLPQWFQWSRSKKDWNSHDQLTLYTTRT